MKKSAGLIALFAIFTLWFVQWVRADQVVLQNGDKLNGKVLSVTTNTLILQNDNFGSVTLPRAKVTAIIFGTRRATSPSPAVSPTRDPIHPAGATQTNSASDFVTAVRGIRDQSNLVQQVQAQILGSGSPAAMNKFNELLDGLSTGKISLNDLRQQAQSAADQLRSLKKDLGPDADGGLDGYLAILNQFLEETASTNVTTNANSVPSKTMSKPRVGQSK